MPRAVRPLAVFATAVAFVTLGASCGEGGPPPEPGGFEVRAETLATADSALRYTASLAFPQIEGTSPGIVAANRLIADTARALVALYRPPGPLPPELLQSNPEFMASVEGGFETVFVRDSLYSGLLTAYAYTGGAHGIQDLRPLNLDLRTGRPILLTDVFRADQPWADSLAAWSTRMLAERLGPDVLFEGRVPDTSSVFRTFTFTSDSLVITFPPYAVAPYAAGPQRVAFAWQSVGPFLAPRGPAQPFYRPPTP